MSTFDASDWDLRNAWLLSSGEVAARQNLNIALSLPNWGGFTIRDPKTDQVSHYLGNGDGSGTSSVDIYDENFVRVTSASLGTKSVPRFMTYAIVEDEIVVAGPDLTTQWGLVGSSLIPAVKVPSVNTSRTVIDIPRGIVVAWADRAVYSDGEGLYFSDALAPRSIVAENIVDPPGGIVYGMHVNAGGALIIVTSNGVWALPEDAAASGQLVLGIWSKLTDYEAQGHQCSCVSQGRVFAVSPRGYRRVDNDSPEIDISEKVMSRTLTERIHYEDYRTVGKMFGSVYGPSVLVPAGFLHRVDLQTGFSTWWSLPEAVGLTGFLTDQDGEELLLNATRLYFSNGNNTAGETSPQAHVAGRIDIPPENAPVLRSVQFSSDSGSTFQVSSRGATKTSTPLLTSPVVGTDSWDTAGLVYKEPPLRSRRLQFAQRGQEVAVEMATSGYPARLPRQVSVAFKGPGKMRPDV